MKNLKIFGLATLICALFALKSSAQSGETPHQFLANKIGKWNVVITLKLGANEPEQVIKGITADRSLVGDYCIHELMHPIGNAKIPDFKRLADLAWNVNEQRWDYTSIDTRITAGIMYFTYQGITGNAITSFITSFPNPGMGPAKKGRGQAMFARNVVVKINNDHDQVKQYWRLTDQKEWLAVQYDYTRSH